jgi:glycosyltransferase involved in cell wall biosynthesis
LFKKLRFLIEHDTAKTFEALLLDIKPDVVHSFALQISCIPILGVMQRHPELKWIYSSWGSDMYYSEEIGINKSIMKICLERIDFLITDCKRDYEIAKQKGFNKIYLGDFPGNGGVDFNEQNIESNLKNRNIIIIKAFNDKIGKGINIVKAINNVYQLTDFELVIFGADKEVEDYIYSSIFFSKLNFKVYNKNNYIPNEELLEIMGKSYIYIGNSYSDGLPNTLIEAMGMGAFPIQSNPGGVTSEIIEHAKNGLLISNPDDVNEIESLIKIALINKKMINDAFLANYNIVKARFDRNKIKPKILTMYEKIIK